MVKHGSITSPPVSDEKTNSFYKQLFCRSGCFHRQGLHSFIPGLQYQSHGVQNGPMYFPSFKWSIFFKANSSMASCTLRGERPALADENSAQPESDLPAVLNCLSFSPWVQAESIHSVGIFTWPGLCWLSLRWFGLLAKSHPRDVASPEFHCGTGAALQNTDSSLHLLSFHWVLATVIWRNPLIKKVFVLPLATASVTIPSSSSTLVLFAFPFFFSQSFFRGNSDDEHGKQPCWFSFFSPSAMVPFFKGVKKWSWHFLG